MMLPPVGVTSTLLPAFLLLCGASWAEPGVGMRDTILGPEKLVGVAHFSTFLLNRTSGVLFLGGRGAVLAVDTNNLDQPPRKTVWNVPEEGRSSCMVTGKTKRECRNYIRLLEFWQDGRVLVCGSYAFNPKCAFLNLSSFTLEKSEDGHVKMESGRAKVPYEPRERTTAVMAGGDLYAATTANFVGSIPAILRATGPQMNRTRTESSKKWLNRPEFVSSAFIETPADGDPAGADDKIYFFFNEVAVEFGNDTQVRVPRVARVCRSDVGGKWILQKRWTTFLKARLLCEDKASGRRYDILRDVFTVRHTPGDAGSTHFYGLFTSQETDEDPSAVCVFSLSAISEVMSGPFKELDGTEAQQVVPESVSSPRPGQCFTNALRAEGFNSSKDLPEDVLTFMKEHPLMDGSVTAAPLLVRKGMAYTKLAVWRASRGEERIVLHLGTDRGELHQVAVVGRDVTVLQEIPLFASQEPINNILLHQGGALVGSPQSLARLQAEGCTQYSSCGVCARARRLGCAWSTKEAACRSTTVQPGPGDAVGEALRRCNSEEGYCSPAAERLHVSVGMRLWLPCRERLAGPCSWEQPPLTSSRQDGAALEVTVTNGSAGSYACTCQEAGPAIGESTPCRRAAYQLTLEDVGAAAAVAAAAAGRHILAIYSLFFCGGVGFGALLLHFGTILVKSRWQVYELPDNYSHAAVP